MTKFHAGFTLIELMISLALGLVIAAAATMLFLTGQKSYVLQSGMSDLQDNANFGLNYIVKDIRLTNLNVVKASTNDETQYGGVILTSSANATLDNTSSPAMPLSNLFRTITGNSAGVNLISRSQGMTAGTAPAWSGISNVQPSTGGTLLSDQLTIQYRPQYVRDDKGTTVDTDDEWVGGYDCEGRELRFRVKNPGGSIPFGQQMVVQRYFLRVDANAMTNEPNSPLALACEAGFYAIADTPAVVRVEGGAPSQALNTRLFGSTGGEIIMKRVDHFRVLLGVQNDTSYRYLPINEYMAIAAGSRPRILSVQIGALVRSGQSVSRDEIISNDQTFQVLDQLVKVKTPAANAPKYVRQVISQTIALRNTFGDR
ncbi:prepilin-type N-terminal cleavage/methylation domain-containing protein [Acinetobacter sp. ANC 4779]|uniref:PilW family protein n=1 Tax=Acinetobacter sp. ANC 4779 TaxID=2529848 RepID=UPI00103AE187|nr:PilW family protein [Acinetobacter sp. ANC 4779]TCB48968.1 prepilin-type N-terminal cleavage/methylation domain-containing protein [Acinetobacter sp. ANC 4779]